MGLDFIRGACALAVCAGHLQTVAIAEYPGDGATTVFQKLFYIMGGLGHPAVMVFFVLSGFFVGGTAFRHRDRFDPLRYAIARLTRIWVVLIPALLATAAIDFALSIYLPEALSGGFRSVWHSGPGGDISYSASLRTFIANVFCLQTIAAPVFGTNNPLWSLSNEFWYYVMFPIMLVTVHGRLKDRKLSAVERMILGAGGLALAKWLPLTMTQGFLIWCMGLIVYAALGKSAGNKNTALLAVGSLLFTAALLYSTSRELQRRVGLPADFAVGAAFCLLAIGIVNRKSRAPVPDWFRRCAKIISEMSFSLYLIHFPCVALIGGFFYRGSKLPPDLAGVACFGLWLMVLLLCGYAFYWAFERRTELVRQWIERF